MFPDKQEDKIFGEMPDEPDILSCLVVMMVMILVLLLAVVGVYTWSRYDFSGSDQVQAEINKLWGQPTGFSRIWNQLTGLSWQ